MSRDFRTQKTVFLFWEGSLVRRLDQLAWSQTQGPFGLTRTPSVHGTPGGSQARSLHQRAAAPRVAGLVPETGWHPSRRASPGPGPEPRSWPFRLACPSPALRSSRPESCEASVEIRTTDCQRLLLSGAVESRTSPRQSGAGGRGARVSAVLRQSRDRPRGRGVGASVSGQLPPRTALTSPRFSSTARSACPPLPQIPSARDGQGLPACLGHY